MPEKPKQTFVSSISDLRSILLQAGVARSAADRIAEGGYSALSQDPKTTLKPYWNPEDDRIMSIQDLRLKRGEIAASLKKLADKPNWSASVDQPKYNALMNDLDGLDNEIRRYQDENERIVAAATRSTTYGQNSYGGQGDREYLDAFTGFLRAPKDMRARANLAEVGFQNAASGGTDAGGGFLVPQEILGPLMKRAANANPFRDLVRVVQVASRDVNFPLSNGDMTTGWVGETVTRTATTEPTVTNAKPTFGMLYSYVEASEELVMDSQFDIGNWFGMEAGDKMGESEMAAIISGNGTDKPSGLLKVAPEAAADGARTAGAFRYLPTGATSHLGESPADLLVSLIYDLKSAYRARASWVMNSQVAAQIRKLKDTQARFLWTDGIAAGEASTLLGYPVRIAEEMAGVGANNFPIMFGDFERGYILAENGGLRVTVDDNITKPGAVRWYLRRRLGGTVYDTNAVRAIKVAVS